jgi:hypothetical protein
VATDSGLQRYMACVRTETVTESQRTQRGNSDTSGNRDRVNAKPKTDEERKIEKAKILY